MLVDPPIRDTYDASIPGLWLFIIILVLLVITYQYCHIQHEYGVLNQGMGQQSVYEYVNTPQLRM